MIRVVSLKIVLYSNKKIARYIQYSLRHVLIFKVKYIISRIIYGMRKTKSKAKEN